jgi:hypothetical protein
VNEAYWARNPRPPFATLIAVAATYCHPEAYDRAYHDLIDRARSAAPDDEEIRVFKSQLRVALADPSLLPGDELFKAVDYGDGSDERFLRRLWRDLDGDEPAAGGSVTAVSAWRAWRAWRLSRDGPGERPRGGPAARRREAPG